MGFRVADATTFFRPLQVLRLPCRLLGRIQVRGPGVTDANKRPRVGHHWQPEWPPISPIMASRPPGDDSITQAFDLYGAWL